jgi:hypothetical protein
MSKENPDAPASKNQRLRGLIILGVCAVVFLGLIAAALIPYLNREEATPKSGGSVGVPAAEAGCGPIQKSSATGGGDHRAEGSKIEYPDGPPASGPHWGNFLYGPQIRNFYTREDRPAVEQLVHSLEHGHTLIWYDETITPGTEAYAALKEYATALSPDDYLMTAPWNAADGAPLPDGKHLVLTHWTGPKDQQAVRQFCAAPSGEVFDAFRKEFTQMDAPEPGAP